MTSNQAVVNKGPRTYAVADGTAVSALRLVKLNASNDGVEHAGASDDVIGQSENDIVAAAASRTRGGTVSVCPLDGQTPRRFVSSAAIALGSQLGKAADGKVAVGTNLNYIAVTAAAAADEIIEAVPFV